LTTVQHARFLLMRASWTLCPEQWDRRSTSDHRCVCTSLFERAWATFAQSTVLRVMCVASSIFGGLRSCEFERK
jgi:hypothetical protein